MLKKSITYENVDGDLVTEDHYFHISKADIVELQFEKEGGLEGWFAQIGQTKDPKEIIAAFKWIVERSYGTRTPAGKFLKDRQTTQEFMSSEAYSEFFMEIVTDANKASEFMNGIIPQGLDKYVEKLETQASAETPALAKAAAALGTEAEKVTALSEVTDVKVRMLTPQEVANMNPDELKTGLATGQYKIA